MKSLALQYLLFLAGLSMLMACADADHQTEGEINHRAHVTNMEPSSKAPLTDGSLYQIGSTWTTQDADVISFGDLRGRFVVMAMTYTSCEFSCPLIVADMKKLINGVPANEKHHVHLVLLSIDPERDTPEVMKAFAAKTGLAPDQWKLLRGDADDVMEMAALLGVRYKKMPDGEYSHANIITLLNPEGEIVHQQNGLGPELTSESSSVLQAMLSEEAYREH